jgi:hypothetical protein
MLSHSRKFIYVRMAKTGSTSFLRYLHKHVSDLRPVVPNTWNDDFRHIPLWAMKQNLGKKAYKNYFKFTFVRNPWARCVSAFEYSIDWARKHNYPLPDSFISFITNTEMKYRSQADFGYGCDYFARLENLSDDLDFICKKLKLPRYKLPHRNKTEHKYHYTEYYDEETKAIVDKMYAKDIEQFGYKFGE